MRHGCCSKALILDGESPDEFRQLHESWVYDYNPQDHTMTELVREVAMAQWIQIRKRGRYNEVEHRIEKEEPNCLNWTAEQHKDLELFSRYVRQAERQFTSALSNLERIRGRVFREGMQLQRAQERVAAIEMKRAEAREAERKRAENEDKRVAVEKKQRSEATPTAAAATETTRSKILFQGQNHAKKRRKIALLEQWVEVTIDEEGKTVTRLFPSNKNLIEHGKGMLPSPELVYRRLNFPHGIPPEYAWTGLREEQKPLGGCGLQRMTTDQWLDVIDREAPEIPRAGYRSSYAPEHIGPTGVGNLPRPKERGGCDCDVCTKNQAILDRKAMAEQE